MPKVEVTGFSTPSDRQPARAWHEALPLGNGRLGAMVFGGVAEERIQLNEDTLWSGEPHDYNHPGAFEHLAEVRQLIAEQKFDDARKLADATMRGIPADRRPINRSAI